MSLRRFALVLLALAVGTTAHAQDGPAAGDRVHTFQVIDGQVHLDGRPLPDAVPASLDLSGLGTGVLEFSGPVAPVVRVGGQAYVLENERLVPLEASSRAGQGVYILGDLAPDPEALPEDRLTTFVEAAYMRDLAATDGSLYSKKRTEWSMEVEARRLTQRFRRLPEGSSERDRLRDELRDLLSDVLSLKNQVLREELDLAQKRLDAVRAGLDQREENHDAMVTSRLQELTGQ